MTKVEFLLNEALSMSSSDKAMIAHCLISSMAQSVIHFPNPWWEEMA